MLNIYMSTYSQAQKADKNTCKRHGKTFRVLCQCNPFENNIVLKMVSLPISAVSSSYEQALENLIQEIIKWCKNMSHSENFNTLSAEHKYITKKFSSCCAVPSRIKKMLYIFQEMPEESSTCWIPSLPTIRKYHFKLFLMNNILTGLFFLSALLVFIFYPRNITGIGYISIFLTCALFIILSLTVLLSSFFDYLAHPGIYIQIINENPIFFITKRNNKSVIDKNELWRYYYILNKIKNIQLTSESVIISGEITNQVLGDSFEPITVSINGINTVRTKTQTEQISIPRYFYNQKLLEAKLKDFIEEND